MEVEERDFLTGVEVDFRVEGLEVERGADAM